MASLQSYNHDRAGPARRRVRRRRLPVIQILQFAMVLFLFRIFLIFELGESGYGAKANALAEGSFMERIAARAMAMDPVTKWAIDRVKYGF